MVTTKIFYYNSNGKLVRTQAFKTNGGYALFELYRAQRDIAAKSGLVIKTGGAFGN